MVMQDVQKQCNTVVHGLIQELKKRFLLHEIMIATNIIYPKFWLQLEAKHIFFMHLSILKVHYFHGMNIGPNQVFIPPLFDDLKLDEQTIFFKMTMMSNIVATMKPLINCNLCSKVWALFVNNQIISHKLFEWLKPIELFMTMVLGSVEDERCFFTFSFTKSKLRNRLIIHLNLVVHMYAQKNYFLRNFQFFAAMRSRTQKKVQRATK